MKAPTISTAAFLCACNFMMLFDAPVPALGKMEQNLRIVGDEEEVLASHNPGQFEPTSSARVLIGFNQPGGAVPEDIDNTDEIKDEDNDEGDGEDNDECDGEDNDENDEDSNATNSTAVTCEEPEMIEALPAGQVGHLTRHVGWHEPCYIYGCYYYCHYCSRYSGKSGKSKKSGKSGKHSYCNLYKYKWACH